MIFTGSFAGFYFGIFHKGGKMAQISINTAEVEAAASRFNKERGDLEALLQNSRSLMNSLQGQFQGQRAQKIFGAWQDMQPNLNGAIIALETAGKLLKDAATAFSQADGIS
jgi:WXG100 family type VII secretion target